MGYLPDELAIERLNESIHKDGSWFRLRFR